MNKIKSKKQSTSAGRKRRNFRVLTNPGSDVYLSGFFNNWDSGNKKNEGP